ncbi:terminase large subunit [Rhodomicrobium lacus]|uniref:terminase large subunit n=1 Tax=Rhodomicrobium lacus TaxID=2498452 RepID=UPI000F8E529A|nr:terminase TerL endonuclease subunit [Rhodomicrobium lacus]
MTALARIPDTSPDLARMPEHVLRTVALTPGAQYDQRTADAAAAFFPRYLRGVEGSYYGRPFRLSPWQEFDIIRPLFGWKRPDGSRLFRKARLWVPRKNGKTTLAAGVGLLVLAGDREYGAQIYSTATNEEQAKLVFDIGGAMLGQSPELSQRLEKFAKKIVFAEMNSKWEPLTAKPKGKHGLNTHLKIGDELHEWSDDKLDQFIRQSMAARRQPLEFDTSTAGERRGFGWEAYQQDQKYLEGALEDPERLIAHYAAGPDDDWQQEETWRKANPNWGISVRPDFIRSEFRKAMDNPRLENDFRRYHLNQWTEQAVRWLQIHRWVKCCDETRPDAWRTILDECRGRPCYIGIDVSSVQDLTAVIYVFPPAGGDMRTRVACRLYVPADNIELRVKRDGVPYDKWAAQGSLIATEGNTIDQETIFADIQRDAAKLSVMRVGIDKWNTGWLGPKLVEHFGMARNPRTGKQEPRVMMVQQGYGSMSPGAKELERLVVAGSLDHGGHPVLKWMASNVAVSVGKQGDIVPIKDKSTDRIDGIVATIIALTLAMAEAVPAAAHDGELRAMSIDVATGHDTFNDPQPVETNAPPTGAEPKLWVL